MTGADPCPRHLYALCRQIGPDRAYLVFQNSPERGIARAAYFPYNSPRGEDIYVVQIDESPDGHRKARDCTVDPHQWYGRDWIRSVWDYFARPDGGHSPHAPTVWKRCDPPEWADQWFNENPPKNEINP